MEAITENAEIALLKGKGTKVKMNKSRVELIETLEQTNQALVEMVASLPEAALDFQAKADDWSIREILAHLVDDEVYVMRTRLTRMVKEELPYLAPHDEKKWYRERNTSRDARDELLADFALQRNASLNIIKMLRPSDWVRRGSQPEYGNFTAEEWLQRWVEHDVNHIQQIKHNLEIYQKNG